MLIPFRPPRYTSLYLHHRAQQLWRILFYTLPLDTLLLLIPGQVPGNALDVPIIIAALIALMLTVREWVFSLLQRGREFRDTWIKPYVAIGAVLIAGLSVFEVLFRAHKAGAQAIVVALIVALPTIIAVRRMIRETNARNKSFEQDRVLWVNQINIQNFIIAVLPMAAARAVSILGVLRCLSSDNPWLWYALPLSFSLVLLIASYPAREHFVVTCSNCGQWTTRALKGLGFCPSCAVEKFEVLDEGTLKKS